jgi:hypothetical protein
MARKRNTQAKKPDTKDNGSTGRSLEDYISDVQASILYLRSNYHHLWRQLYRVYRNMRVKIGYEGYSDAVIPESFTIIESLVANIAGSKPKFNFLPTEEEQEQDVTTINELMNYIWENNHMDQKSQVWVREMLQYGTGVLYVAWDAETNLPIVRNVPVYDFIFDPTASSLDGAHYVGYRYLANRSDLKKAKIVDPDTGELKPMYDMSKLEEVEGSKTGDQLDKEIKDILNGSTVPKTARTNQLEVIVLFYKDGTMVTLGNRQAILAEGPSPYQAKEKTVTTQTIVNGMPQDTKRKIPAIKPFYPFALLRDYVDPSLLLGTGELEIIMDRQETLNDVENMDLDNTSYANNIMWQIDPQYADLMPEIIAAPGLVVPIPQNALSVIQRPQATMDLDNTKNQIKEEMRRATAADEVIQGVSQDQGRVTATEVQTQLNQSHQRFSTKLNNLESEGYAQLASVLLKSCQIFITEEQAVRIIGDDGVHWKDYNPAEFTGDYQPVVKLDSTVKQMKLEEGQKLNQMYQLILNNPAIDQKEALRFVLNNLGAEKDEIEKLLNAPVATPPQPVPKVNINLAGDLPPVQAAAIGDASVPQNAGQLPGQGGMPMGAGTMPVPDNMLAPSAPGMAPNPTMGPAGPSPDMGGTMQPQPANPGSFQLGAGPTPIFS